jgi:hypothetical protein
MVHVIRFILPAVNVSPPFGENISISVSAAFESWTGRIEKSSNATIPSATNLILPLVPYLKCKNIHKSLVIGSPGIY